MTVRSGFKTQSEALRKVSYSLLITFHFVLSTQYSALFSLTTNALSSLCCRFTYFLEGKKVLFGTQKRLRGSHIKSPSVDSDPHTPFASC
jgi:hypothetical protein